MSDPQPAVPRHTADRAVEGEPALAFDGPYRRLFDLWEAIPNYQALEGMLVRRAGISPLMFFWMKASGNKSSPPLELETIGRKTGAIRSVVVPYWEVDGSYVVMGTAAGGAKDPHWVRNLRVHPACHAWIRRKRIELTARIADDAERDRLIERGVTHSWLKTYLYRAREKGREVPFVVLTPVA
jgi:deazaflavin-dependent oxidoreductase (nitroreductase family)